MDESIIIVAHAGKKDIQKVFNFLDKNNIYAEGTLYNGDPKSFMGLAVSNFAQATLALSYERKEITKKEYDYLSEELKKRTARFIDISFEEVFTDELMADLFEQVSDLVHRMLVQKYLEDPVAYKKMARTGHYEEDRIDLELEEGHSVTVRKINLP